MIISGDGTTSDLGYPSTVELADGSLLTVWYELRGSSPGDLAHYDTRGRDEAWFKFQVRAATHNVAFDLPAPTIYHARHLRGHHWEANT